MAISRAFRTHRPDWSNERQIARMLRNAPKAPTHKPGNRSRNKTNLNAKLWALHRAIQEQKRRKAQENENRRLRILALSFPAAPRTRIPRG